MTRVIIFSVVAAFTLSCSSAQKVGARDSAKVRPSSSESFREKAPTPSEALPKKTLPAFKKSALRNGLSLYLLERKSLPVVTLAWVFAFGSADEGESPGIASATLYSLMQGSMSMSAAELYEEMAELGMDFDISVGVESSAITVSFPREKLTEALTLMGSLSAPRFSKEGAGLAQFIARQKDSALDEGRQRLPFGIEHPNSPKAAAEFFYTPQALKSFWQTKAGPKTSALVFAGDVSEKTLKAEVKGAFKSWRARAKRKPAPTLPSDLPGFALLDRPGPLARVMMSNVLGKLDEKEQATAALLIHALGGMRASRWQASLPQVSRESQNMLAIMLQSRMGSVLVVDAVVKRRDLVETTYRLVEESARLQREGLTPIELARVSRHLSNQVRGAFLTQKGAIQLGAQLFSRRLDAQFYSRWVNALESVTPADIEVMSKRVFSVDQRKLLVIGDATLLLENLRALEVGDVVVEVEDDVAEPSTSEIQ